MAWRCVLTLLVALSTAASQAPGAVERSCLGVCGQCWYDEPVTAASKQCCCTADCAAHGDCCADYSASCASRAGPAEVPQPTAAAARSPPAPAASATLLARTTVSFSLSPFCPALCAGSALLEELRRALAAFADARLSNVQLTPSRDDASALLVAVALDAGVPGSPGRVVDALLDGTLLTTLRIQFPIMPPGVACRELALSTQRPRQRLSSPFVLHPAPLQPVAPAAPPATAPTEVETTTKGLAPLSFCASKKAARFYAQPRSCDCGCPGCNCRGYWACWACSSGGGGGGGGSGGTGCRYGSYYECPAQPLSTFLEAAQACGWAREAVNLFACPPPDLESLHSVSVKAALAPPQRPQLAPLPPLSRPVKAVPYPPWPPYPQGGQGQGGQGPQGPAPARSCAGACGRCLQEQGASGAFLCCCDAPCGAWAPATGQPPGYLGCCPDYRQACPAPS